MLRGLIAAALALVSAAAPAAVQGPAQFDWFEYRGNDGLPKPAPGEYANPILQGFYPDPSIVRVGSDFYLVNSTFAWFPGMPVFHSRDLVHWTQSGNAFDRSSQLNLGKLGMGQGLYAPDISWHDGTFYLVNTCVGCGDTFVMTAKRAEGPWSDPVFLPQLAGAIDPSIFFDGDGTAWVVNNGPPAEKPRYEGHRAIWIQKFDFKAMKMVGPRKVLVDGGVHPEQNPIWIEGPHLIRKDGFYYLIAAEGGTADQHSEVVFRAKTVTGPYVPLESNPILTQRDLANDRPRPITSTGHAKFVETPAGDWWAVFLGVRPYDARGNFNTGRETFMLPVRWQDGWPRILRAGQPVPWTVPAPKLPRQKAGPPTNGDFTVREYFTGTQLTPHWMVLRNPQGRWWHLRNGTLQLHPRRAGLGDHGNPSLLARRQQHLNATATTRLRFNASSDHAEAGIAAFQNDEHWYLLAVARDRGNPVIRVRRRSGETEPANGTIVAQAPLPVSTPIQLRIVARGAHYDFAWSSDGRRWRTLVNDADGTVLSTQKAGGFVGAVFGLYAHSGEGQ
jgi:alpha-N-arabinofuranosidase